MSTWVPDSHQSFLAALVVLSHVGEGKNKNIPTIYWNLVYLLSSCWALQLGITDKPRDSPGEGDCEKQIFWGKTWTKTTGGQAIQMGAPVAPVPSRPKTDTKGDISPATKIPNRTADSRNDFHQLETIRNF